MEGDFQLQRKVSFMSALDVSWLPSNVNHLQSQLTHLAGRLDS